MFIECKASALIFALVLSQLETNGVTAKLTEVIVWGKKTSKKTKNNFYRSNIYILKLRKLNFYTPMYTTVIGKPASRGAVLRVIFVEAIV